MKKFLPVIGLALSTVMVSVVLAAPPGSPFLFGETLDPSCAPGDTNCTVELLNFQADGNADLTVTTFEDGGSDHSAVHLRFANGTAGAPTLVDDSEEVALFDGSAWDGDEWNDIGFISIFTDDPTANDDTPGRMVFGTASDGTKKATEKMRLTKDGYLGIGTTTPSAFLEIDTDLQIFPDTWEGQLRLVGDDHPALWLHSEGNDEGWIIGNDSGSQLEFNTTNGTNPDTDIMHLDEDGQMFMGFDFLSFTDEELHIAPSDGGTSSDTAISMENNAHIYEIHVEDGDEFVIYENENEDSGNSVLMYNGATDHWGFGTDPTAAEFTTATGATLTTGGVWTDSSSRELKKDIEGLSLEDALRALDGLEPVSFTYLREEDEQYLGFIAEDVPDLVAMKDRKGLNAMDMVAVLTKVVQQQQSDIEQLKELLCLDHAEHALCQ